MSFAHTGSGARFIALWGKPTLSPQHELGLQHPELFPIEKFTVTDDRGSAYALDFTHGGGSEWITEINLHPAPPDDIRWLEIAAPPSPAVRVDLTPAGGPPGGEPEVSETTLSPGEQLLIMLAEQLLTVAAQFPLAPGPGRPEAWSRPVVKAMGTGLGDVIAGLEAVDVLSPLSPVPARLAALCASMSIDGHGIAAAPTADLPEPWLSLLAYYQRRKHDTAQVRDGFAALAAALPELDGIRLALVGLHNTGGSHGAARAGPGRAAGRTSRPARHQPGLPAVVLAPRQWRPVARGPPGRLAPDRPRARDRAAARAAAAPVHGLGRGAGRRPVGRGPRQTTAALGVPAVIIMPNGGWFDSFPSCEAHVPCGQGRHIVRWEAGALRLPSHPDAEAELVLAALGGEKARCVEVAQAWGRHAEDLSVLAIGPRGPRDEIAVSWDDVDAAVQAGRSGPHFGPPGSRPMRLASPSIPLAARARARQQQDLQDRERAARRRNDMLSLLALGYGFQVRLIGQVAQAHADRPDEAMEKIRPPLVAAIAARLAPVAEKWLGIDPDQVVVSLHRGPGWGSVELTGRGEQRRLRASLPAGWLARVWAPGLALTGRHLVVAVERAGWPDARVLALRSPNAEPAALDAHATATGPVSGGLDVRPSAADAPHWEV